MTKLYRFRLDQDPAGYRYVRQSITDGESTDLRISEQSAYRFGSYQEAIAAGKEWERRAAATAAATRRMHTAYHEVNGKDAPCYPCSAKPENR